MTRSAPGPYTPTPQPMARADCHVCGANVAVRKGGELREHRFAPSDERPCSGSGQQAQVDQAEVSAEAEPRSADGDATMLSRRVGWRLGGGMVPISEAREELRDSLGVRRLAPGQYEAAARRGAELGWWVLSGDLSLLPLPPRAPAVEGQVEPDPALDAKLIEAFTDAAVELATLGQDVELEAEASARSPTAPEPDPPVPGTVAIDSIRVATGQRRELRPEAIDRLVESIRLVGLLQPIVVTAELDLVAGRHRLEAARRLGWASIPARTIDDVDAELAEIDENLVRSELTALERGEAVARRKRLYEERHPEVRHGGAPGAAGGGKRARAKDDTVSSFADDTAARIGASARTVQRDVQIGELPAEVREAVRGTPLEDNRTALAELARIEGPERQIEVAQKVLQQRADTRREVTASMVRARARAVAPAPTVELDDTPTDPASSRIDLRLASCADVDWPSGDLIIADPPWSYVQRHGQTRADNHYRVLPTGTIVEHLAWLHGRAPRLALWITFPLLGEWERATRGWPWGSPKTGGAWIKSREGDEGHYGQGYHWAGCSEIVLVYTSGSPYTDPASPLRNAWIEDPGEHSRKPVGWQKQWIQRWVPAGGLVLDPYSGLASVPEAVLLAGEGRRCIAAEEDPERHTEARALLMRVSHG